MKRSLPAMLLLSAASVAGAESPPPMQACPPQGWTPASLQALKVRSFPIPDRRERLVLAEGLLACLADSDPVLRDGIAYAVLSQWMRAGKFDDGSLQVA